jgi:HPt (histidine-containing phosphotransfer) domain-containing protein
MVQLATKIIDQEPATPAPAIDTGQLAHMTFGDRSLAREVLQLFDRQSDLLLARMYDCDPPAVASLAHTLKGSASSIGATGVVHAAAAVEQAGSAPERLLAIGGLATAIAAARAAIAELLRTEGIAQPPE